MIVISEVRCSDCLKEFAGAARWGVIKEDKSQSYNAEERLLGAHLYRVLVCDDCAGWYPDALYAGMDGEA
jgi:hypothetical protein